MKNRNRFFLAPDDGANPQMNVVPEEEEEVIIVNSKEEIPEEEPSEDDLKVENEPKESIEEIIRRVQEGNLSQQEKLVNSIGEALKSAGSSQQQKPQESDEDFAKRIEKMIYGKQPVEAIREVLTKAAGPVLQSQQQYIASLEDRMLCNDPADGEFYKKHKKEIDQAFDKLHPQQKLQPGMRQQILSQVKTLHLDEIIAERVAQQVKEALEKSGGEVAAAPQQGTTYVSGGGVRTASTGNTPRKKYVVVSPEEQKEADMIGMDPQMYHEIMHGGGSR